MDDQLSSPISIETLDPIHVACFRSVSPTPEDDGHKFMAGWIARQNIQEPVHEFGFDVDVTPEEQKAGFRGYEFWKTVPSTVQPSEGVTIRDFEGGLYAVMTLYKPFSDPFARIPAGWKKLHEWVIASDQYRSGNHQWLEGMINHPDGDDLKLYHPVVFTAEKPAIP